MNTRHLTYIILIVGMLLFTPSVLADIYDAHGNSISSYAPSVTVCAVMHITVSEEINLTGIQTHASEGATKWYVWNDTWQKSGSGADCSSPSVGTLIDSGSISSSFGNITTPITLVPGLAYSITVDAEGSARDYYYDGTSAMPLTGNGSIINYNSSWNPGPNTMDYDLRSILGTTYTIEEDIGGNTTSITGYEVITFNGNDTYIPAEDRELEVLIVAGGGGAGQDISGGGGGGGVIYNASINVSAGVPYVISVGEGGAGGSGTLGTCISGSNGQDSAFDVYTATGGGGGGAYGATTCSDNGENGGSGGGGGTKNNAGDPTGGTGTAGQGYDGGDGEGGVANNWNAGGGGGAGSAGADYGADQSGNGGTGYTSSINGTSIEYACGGAGGAYTSGQEGTGGCSSAGDGGYGTSAPNAYGGDGTDGTGSGGGGGGYLADGGGDGGDGIVIIRYATAGATPSDHKVETVTKQQQTTNVSLNSNTFSSIYSYSFTPNNETQFYQTFTVPVDPTQNNGLECKIQIDGVDNGGTFSRTNTAGEKGQLLIKSNNLSLDNTSHTIDLQCRRSTTPVGAMTLYDIVGAGHLLFDQASGQPIPYTIGNFTNSTNSATLTPIYSATHTTNDTELISPIEHHVIMEWVASITNNAGSTETINFIPNYGTYNCSTTWRTIGSGGTGSVGGTCAIKNVTNNTAYTYQFYANGTNAEYQVTYDLKEFFLHDEDINTIQIDWTKGAETGWNKINNISIQQDLGASQDIYGQIGISQEGSGGDATYELRLSGDADVNSSEFQRYVDTSYGVLGVHNVFQTLATGNYSVELWAEVTSIDEIIGELTSYEAGKQIITENIEDFTARTNLTNTSLSDFSIVIGNNTYTTSGTTIELPNLGVQNITYVKDEYNNQSYADINTSASSYIGYLCQVNLYFTNPTDSEGNDVSYPFNVSYLGNETTINSNSDTLCVAKNETMNLTFSKDEWYDKTEEYEQEDTGLYNYTFSDITNTYIDYVGSTSGNDYDVQMQCKVGSNYLNKINENYYTILANETLICDEGTQYPAFNETLNITSYPAIYNKTATPGTQINVTEYQLSLTFDTNTTGNVTWTHDTDENSRGQFPLNETYGYNVTTFEWIKIKANWSDNTLIKVTFNELLQGFYNSSAQYYIYRNDLTTTTTENMKVLDALDGTVWVNVLNYAQEELLEATVRVEYCPTTQGVDCEVVSQVLTEPQTGDASPGTPIYLDTGLDYWITVSKTGYEPQALLIRGLDLIDDEILEVKLKPLFTSATNEFYIYGPKIHHNNSKLYYTISYFEAGNYFYTTTYNSAHQSKSFGFNGADSLVLENGVDYENNTDFVLYLWTYNSSSGSYIAQSSQTVEYRERDYRSIVEKIGDNSTLRAVLWVFLILMASLVGSYVTKDGLDTGYYIFGAGVFVLAIISPMFIPVAVSIAVIYLGGMAFSVSRE